MRTQDRFGRNDDWRGTGSGRSVPSGRDRESSVGGSMPGGTTDYGYGGSDERIHQGFGDSMSGRGSARGARLGQGPHAGKGPKGYQRSDDRIREDVSDALAAHGDVDASEIEVQVANGEVTLTGTVDSREAKRHAEMALDEIMGVNQVHNQLRVSRADNGNMATWMEQQGGSFVSGPAATGTYAPNTGGPNQPSHSRSDTRSDTNISGSTGTTNQSGRDSGSDQATSNQSSTTSTGTSTKGERGGSQSRSSR